MKAVYYFSQVQKLKKFVPPKQQQEVKLFRPFQHPSHQMDNNLEIQSPTKRERFISRDSETMHSLYLKHSQPSLNSLADRVADNVIRKPVIQPSVEEANQRFLSMAIVGPPNAGKSTFMNYLIGQPVSAVSNKSNTTNDAITGIYTDIESGLQLELIDTPGIFSKYKFGKYFTTKSWDVLDRSNLCCVMVDGVKTLDVNLKNAMTRLNSIQIDRSALQQFQKLQHRPASGTLTDIKESVMSALPKILVINKMDICFNKRKLQWLLTELEDLTRFDKVFYISSVTGYGIGELKQYLLEQSFICPWKYKESQCHDMTPLDQIQQMVKSAIFKRLYREVPFVVGVSTKEFRITNKSNARIVFQLNVQTDCQAKIVIGEKGRNIKWLQTEIQLQVVKVFKKMFDIQLKVTKKIGDKQYEFDQEDNDFKAHTVASDDNIQKQEHYQNLNKQFEAFLNL